MSKQKDKRLTDKIIMKKVNVIYCVLGFVIVSLIFFYFKIASENAFNKLYVNIGYNSTVRENDRIVSQLKNVRTLVSEKVGYKIDSIEVYYSNLKNNNNEESFKNQFYFNSDLMTFLKDISICPPRFDEKFFFSFPSAQFSKKDSIAYQFEFRLNAYLFEDTWSVVGFSNPNIKQLADNSFLLVLPKDGSVKPISFYLRNNYTNDLDTLRSRVNFY